MIKFNGNTSSAFKNSAIQFCQIFSREAINSLCILCIQGDQSITHSTLEFKRILTNSERYLYLKEKNSDKNVAFILWDNFLPKIDDHVGQMDKLNRITSKLVPFNKIKMQRAIGIVELKLSYLRPIKYEKQSYSQYQSLAIVVSIFFMGFFGALIILTKLFGDVPNNFITLIYLFFLDFSFLWFNLFKIRISLKKQ